MDFKPTQQQVDEAYRLYKTSARNMMDACDRVCTGGNSQFNALMLLVAAKIDEDYGNDFMTSSVRQNFL